MCVCVCVCVDAALGTFSSSAHRAVRFAVTNSRWCALETEDS